MHLKQLLGQGVAFPPRIGPNGSWAWSDGAENVRESIQIILLTAQRERLLLPEFGAGLHIFLYEMNSLTTRHLIQKAVLDALNRWEPRIEVREVTVEQDPADAQVARITIAYALLPLQTPESITLTLNLAQP